MTVRLGPVFNKSACVPESKMNQARASAVLFMMSSCLGSKSNVFLAQEGELPLE